MKIGDNVCQGASLVPAAPQYMGGIIIIMNKI